MQIPRHPITSSQSLPMLPLQPRYFRSTYYYVVSFICRDLHSNTPGFIQICCYILVWNGFWLKIIILYCICTYICIYVHVWMYSQPMNVRLYMYVGMNVVCSCSYEIFTNLMVFRCWKLVLGGIKFGVNCKDETDIRSRNGYYIGNDLCSYYLIRRG